jgi:hypothetical protein
MVLQKAKGRRQKAKGKRQKAKGKRQKAKGRRVNYWYVVVWAVKESRNLYGDSIWSEKKGGIEPPCTDLHSFHVASKFML